MFKNKHIITALIVTPILAVLAYFATDYMVSEQPHVAKDGGRYELVQLPNCRYASGRCELKNGNFKVVVTGRADESGFLSLNLASEFPLTEAYVSVVREADAVSGPMKMAMITNDDKTWQVNLQVIKPIEQILRVVVASGGAIYYAETGMPFLNYETSFKKDFRSER